MAKKKKGPTLEAWCWYCDREFEDEKVLLQHQKAKHYRCPQCPRRLNTAGGLAVHLQQVHKSEPGRLENTLPGRDTFDIEIYGMEGIPAADLAEYHSRKAARAAGTDGGGGGEFRSSKKPRVDKSVIPADRLRAQLEAHKALMAGKAPPLSVMSALAGMAPPGLYAGPPPGFAQIRPLPGPYSGPPPAFPPPGFSGSPPGMPGAAPSTPSAAPPAAPQPSPHQRAIKSGAKSRMVYTDAVLSPDEKLASTSKYTYLDPEDPADAMKIQAQQQANVLPGWQQFRAVQPPPAPAQGPPGYGAAYGRFNTGAPALPPPMVTLSQQVQAYPIASPGNAAPASADPENLTTEALATANAAVVADPAAAMQHEADIKSMHVNAATAAADSEMADQDSSQGGLVAGQKRARAADLF
ncbi:hypothetical protein K437DRAFT_72830 [Tilletiaria anomala UBC 951]|uniref:C2H2-type domain-containing protein n=1 Tax=Tilletiaria anomala (strain ATCC 24038 / CBS 436.72 / UBC 951) TaxID=1037660 RepID=A0A066WLL6_TILAU|nr:uncharacterized protein K437DRAFT_72830 [Tilletiaria anomala UBC 951]KDN53488.1 hypothetical protein K437DRAFT_72830 [Tilletiaria anomala UBC 951]